MLLLEIFYIKINLYSILNLVIIWNLVYRIEFENINIVNLDIRLVIKMSKRKTHSEFIEEMNEINADIEILGKYINNREKIKCRCLIDNYEWEAIPSNL